MAKRKRKGAATHGSRKGRARQVNTHNEDSSEKHKAPEDDNHVGIDSRRTSAAHPSPPANQSWTRWMLRPAPVLAFIGIILAYCQLDLALQEQKSQTSLQEKQRYYQAWQTITTAQGKPGGGGGFKLWRI